jgi:hypothetical protein
MHTIKQVYVAPKKAFSLTSSSKGWRFPLALLATLYGRNLDGRKTSWLYQWHDSRQADYCDEMVEHAALHDEAGMGSPYYQATGHQAAGYPARSF